MIKKILTAVESPESGNLLASFEDIEINASGTRVLLLDNESDRRSDPYTEKNHLFEDLEY